MHFQLLLEKFENLNRQLLYTGTNFFDYRCYYTYEYHLFSLKCNKEREINTHYCLELHKTRTMNYELWNIWSTRRAAGNAQHERDWSTGTTPSTSAIRSHSDSSLSYSGTMVHHSQSLQRFADDHDRTLVIVRFRHLLQFLVLLLLRGHLHPAINIVRLEYSGWGD